MSLAKLQTHTLELVPLLCGGLQRIENGDYITKVCMTFIKIIKVQPERHAVWNWPGRLCSTRGDEPLQPLNLSSVNLFIWHLPSIQNHHRVIFALILFLNTGVVVIPAHISKLFFSVESNSEYLMYASPSYYHCLRSLDAHFLEPLNVWFSHHHLLLESPPTTCPLRSFQAGTVLGIGGVYHRWPVYPAPQRWSCSTYPAFTGVSATSLGQAGSRRLASGNGFWHLVPLPQLKAQLYGKIVQLKANSRPPRHFQPPASRMDRETGFAEGRTP